MRGVCKSLRWQAFAQQRGLDALDAGLALQVAGHGAAAACPCEFGVEALQAAPRCQVQVQGDAAVGRDGVAQRCGQCIDQAAFDPACRHQALACALVALAVDVGEVGHHRLQGLAAKALQEVRAPGAVLCVLSVEIIGGERSEGGTWAIKGADAGAVDIKTTICRQQIGDLDPSRAQHRHPGAIRAESRPAAAAQGEQHRVGVNLALTVRGREAQVLARRRCFPRRVCVVLPAQPAMAHLEAHARRTQAREPGAQQGRRLHFLGEDAA